MTCAHLTPRSLVVLHSRSLPVTARLIVPRTRRNQRRPLCLQPSVSIHVCNALPSSVTQPEGSVDLQGDSIHSSSNGSSPPAAAAVEQQETQSWEEDSSSKAAEGDWQGSKPFTLKDVDWGEFFLLVALHAACQQPCSAACRWHALSRHAHTDGRTRLSVEHADLHIRWQKHICRNCSNDQRALLRHQYALLLHICCT
jgi:hypothetical protein